MNKSKAIVGWDADLVNGRDFRVEDHLDGRGQTIVWLRENLPVPDHRDLDAGWVNWLAKNAAPTVDPMALLASQIERILQAIDLPSDDAFQAFLDAHAIAKPTELKETPHE